MSIYLGSNMIAGNNGTVSAETLDSVPVGGIIDFEGDEVPVGYEEVPSIVDIVYPVGAIFMSTSPTDPQLLFEGTEWRQLKDRFLLAAGDTYEAGTSGGSDTHKHGLTSGWANINSSGKTIIYQYKTGTSWKANYQVVGSSGASSSTSYSDVTTLGGTTDNANNLPPYLTVYMWERIA
jgi:hypothetical protein